MGLGDILEIGQQGLAAQRQALQTTTNNIANTNTPGYTRQKPVLQAREQIITDGVILGGGVTVSKVTRVHDAFVDRQLVDESRGFGTAKIRAEGLEHMEGLLSRNGFELGELTNKFFNAYRELSANPETPSLRSEVADAAGAAAKGFRSLSDSMDNMKRDLDLRLTQTVESVNAYTKELASLNEKIERYEASGMSPNELEDRRDLIVKDLSQKLGYPVLMNDKGQVNFGATGIGALVEAGGSNDLVVVRTPEAGNKAAGSLDIFVKDAFGLHKISGTFKEGEIAGMIQIRDDIVNTTKKQLDHAAFEFANAVNEVHRSGFGGDGETNRNMFNPLASRENAAEMLDVSDDVKNSFQSIAVAEEKGAFGDNRLALRMAELQNKAIMPMEIAGKDGAGKETDEGSPRTYTLTQSLNALLGSIATQTQREKQLFTHQEAVVNQLENYRQSVSGVSLEEEAMHMMQQQAVFNAAAKTMKVGDELIQTVLNLRP